jgi:hypothetical protein
MNMDARRSGNDEFIFQTADQMSTRRAIELKNFGPVQFSQFQDEP